MKILVGYDRSNVGKKALELARKRGKICEASIEVVFAMAQNRGLEYLDIQRVEHMIQREVKSIFKGNNIPYETRIAVTKLDSGEELIEFAKQNKIDEIIIGVKQKSKVGKLLFGSTAQYVILNAPCPVVTIK
jgi:nucleotide-binding universal stress UspA family protein